MLESILLIDEERRLATLLGLNILDTPAEERFDSLTRIAQRCFDAPIVLITLLDSNRQWFKSKQGLDTAETPRSISFCDHAIRTDDTFVISDSLLDSRFVGNPLVMGAPYIRFYAGQPLKARNGSRLGTLCIIDGKPRQLSQADLDLLRDLGALVECELNLRDTLEIRDTMLCESAAIMSATINSAMDAVMQMDAQGTISGWNHQAEIIFGWTSDEALGRKMHDTIIPPQHRQAHIRGMTHFLATGEGPVLNKRIEISALHRDGHEFPIELSIAPLEIAGKYQFSAFLRDITVRKQVESQLRLLEASVAQLNDVVIITEAAPLDASGPRIVFVNEAAVRTTGFTRAELLGQTIRILQGPSTDQAELIRISAALIKTGSAHAELIHYTKAGAKYWIEANVTPVLSSAGVTTHFVAIGRDITKRKQAEQDLAYIAHYDVLTNLPNRVLLGDRLQQAMLQSQRRDTSLAVVCLDLDGFKRINDKYGHTVGDELLVALSLHIKAALREGDTLARVGGDEFVVVLVDLEDPTDCEPVLARLLQVVSQAVTVDDMVLHVSASIGVTLYPQDSVDADVLLRHADQAMYIAKDSGKNCHHFFDVVSASAVQTLRKSLQEFAQALVQQEFVLHYQPKVNMKTGVVVGAEALIRWQHPVRGLLPPAAFLPTIEDDPLSVELGRWVIATALAQMCAWHGQGLDLSVSVNIGARQLQQTDFAARLVEMLAAHPKVKPHDLQLEVLETSALEDIARVGAVMQACKAIGVGFALDDFGTGYSSLTYLKRLPAEVLKIDQSFVREMLTDSDDMAIVQGIISLASAFRRSVIAEGVETQAHGALLLKLGCELAQGYGIARPMPAADLPGWVERWHAKAVWTA